MNSVTVLKEALACRPWSRVEDSGAALKREKICVWRDGQMPVKLMIMNPSEGKQRPTDVLWGFVCRKELTLPCTRCTWGRHCRLRGG